MDVSGLPVSALVLDGIVAAAVAIYLPFAVVAYYRLQLGAEARAMPRAMVDKLPPVAQRATWAHANGFETFLIFAVAALMAYGTGQTSPLAAIAALGFPVARVFYALFYILNIPILRSLMFAIGSLCSATLFGLSLISVN